MTLSIYDAFSAPTINPDKWIGLESSGLADTEVYRRIVQGQAQLLLRTAGSNASDTGFTRASNRLRIGHRALLTGSPRITAMEARMTLLAAEVDTCATNLTPFSDARVQVVGVFFNDGTGNNRPGDRTGDVSAGVIKAALSDARRLFLADVRRCADAACGTVVSVGVKLFARSWAVGDTDLMRVVWNAAANNFVFTVNKVAGPSSHGSESVTLTYTGSDTALPKRFFNDFTQILSINNCTGGAVSAFMDLRVDNVQLNTDAVNATLP